jgi:hypothetical protein
MKYSLMILLASVAAYSVMVQYGNARARENLRLQQEIHRETAR